MREIERERETKGCVTPWPCHLHEKVSSGKRRSNENSNISPCKNIIFEESSKANQNPSRDYNSVTNLKFQHKPNYHFSKVLI
jgi:hypothetical protein